MEILLTGATGSVGSQLRFWLEAHGPDEVEIHPHDQRNDDIYNVNKSFKVDCVVICQGGHRPKAEQTFESNAISIGRDLAAYEKILKKDGCIIVVSSRRGLLPTVKEWHYSAAKAACRAYCIALYKDRPDLRITCLCPGWLESAQAKRDKAKRVISISNLADLIITIARCKTMRIPEIVMEPIGEAQYT